MKIRQLLFDRWTSQPWNAQNRISESLKKISARLGKSQLKRYCLGVMVQYKGPMDLEGDVSQDAMLDALGNLNLSHHGGHLVENLPVRLITISNDIEGYLPDEKRGLIVPDAGYQAGPNQVFEHNVVLAYADRFFANGETDAIDRCQGAKPISMMSGDSEFQAQLNNLPVGVSFPDGLNISVWLWVLETNSEIVDRPTRIVQKTDLRDPIELPYAFKKPAFIALCTQPDELNKLNGRNNVFPRIEVDGISQLEQLNVLEMERGMAWLRPDGDKLGGPGLAAGTLLGRTTTVLLDPFGAQKMTYFNSGHDWNIWGQLQSEQTPDGFLITIMRIYENLAATDYAVQMARDNIDEKTREQIYVGGKPLDEHHMTRGELLGVQATILTRAAHRQRVNG